MCRAESDRINKGVQRQWNYIIKRQLPLQKCFRTKNAAVSKQHSLWLDRIAAVEDTVGAFVTVTGEEALRRAKEIDDRRAAGEELPPLAGVPVAIKGQHLHQRRQNNLFVENA